MVYGQTISLHYAILLIRCCLKQKIIVLKTSLRNKIFMHFSLWKFGVQIWYLASALASGPSVTTWIVLVFQGSSSSTFCLIGMSWAFLKHWTVELIC